MQDLNNLLTLASLADNVKAMANLLILAPFAIFFGVVVFQCLFVWRR